jgi:transposase
MPISSCDQIVLCEGQRRLLMARAGRVSGEHCDVVPARIVLAAADGASNAAIGRALGVCDDTVRKWRQRFCQHGIDGLRDRPRTGRPRRFSATVVAEVKALACELPAKSDVPLAKSSYPDLATEAIQRGVAESVSASTVRRWLSADALKPWQHRSWICRRDPHFAIKAARVLELYARVWDGEPLGENDYVLSADEKPGVQARSRVHPSRSPGPSRRPMRVESDYRRRGTLAYLAAYDVHRAHVIGHCATQHRYSTVYRAGQQGHDWRALRFSAASVLGGRQRRITPRLDRRSTVECIVIQRDSIKGPNFSADRGG